MERKLKDVVKEQFPPEIIISIIFVIMIVVGYGVWSEETSGMISLETPVYGTAIIIDQNVAGVSKTAGEKMSYQFSAGKHNVILSRNDFYPWTKDVLVTAKKTSTLNPFFVRKEIKTNEITKTTLTNGISSYNPDYYDALKLFADNTLKDEFKTALSQINFSDARFADYFPGRNDVLIVAKENKIYAVEISATTPRNIFPLYQGTEPTFVKTANNVIIVKDGESLFRITSFDK